MSKTNIPSSNDVLPVVKNSEDIEVNYEKIVKIEGIYRQMNVNKRPDKITYSGRVYIELEKGSEGIALETQEKGVRDKAEIAKFENKTVSVVGVLSRRSVLWGDGTMASIASINVKQIQSIEFLK